LSLTRVNETTCE